MVTRLARSRQFALRLTFAVAVCFVFVLGTPLASAYAIPMTGSYGNSTHPKGEDAGTAPTGGTKLGHIMTASCDAPACDDVGVSSNLVVGGKGYIGDPFNARPVYNFQDISTTGTKLTMSTGYGTASATITLPFIFEYYGKQSTSWNVCQQGMLWASLGTTTFPGCNMPYGYYLYEPSTPYYNIAYSIAPYWAPLTPDTADGTSAVYYQVSGPAGAQVAIIQWNHLQFCTAATTTSSPATCTAKTGHATFEVKLFQADSRIEFHYGDFDSTGVPPAIGIQGAGTSATEIGVNAEPSSCCGVTGTHGMAYFFSAYSYCYGYYPTATPTSGGYNYCYMYGPYDRGTVFGNGRDYCYASSYSYTSGSYTYYDNAACSTYIPPKGLVIAIQRNQAPKGAAIAATVNEGVPTLLQIPGSDPEGRPVFGSSRPAEQRYLPASTTTSCYSPTLPSPPAVPYECATTRIGNWNSLVKTQPSHGTVVPVNPTVDPSTGKQPLACPSVGGCNGYFVYTSQPDFNGLDTFTYQVSDGFTPDPTVYTATIKVTPINDNPVGLPDKVQVWDYPHPITIYDPGNPLDDAARNILANDTDVELTQGEGPNGICQPTPSICPPPNQHLHVDVTQSTVPAGADTNVWQLNKNGSFTYQASSPCTATSCIDTFAYTPCDDNSVSTKHGSLPKAPNPPTDPPGPAVDGCAPQMTPVLLDVRHWDLRAEPEDYTILEDNTFTMGPQIGLRANDPGSANASYIQVEYWPQFGSLSLNPDGSFTYAAGSNLCNTPGTKSDYMSYHLVGLNGQIGNTVADHFFVLCVDDAPLWDATVLNYDLPGGAQSVNEPNWAFGLGTTSLFDYSRWTYVNVANGILPGPCTPVPPSPSGAQDECSIQKMHFAVTMDHPELFAVAPHVTMKTDTTYTKAPYYSAFQPTYGTLNFTTAGRVAGTAKVSICLVDDGIVNGTANARGSIDRLCKSVRVHLPGPPITTPDLYNAYGGHWLFKRRATGVLANDATDSGIPFDPIPGGPRPGFADFTALLFAAPSHAKQFYLNADGSFGYLPDPMYKGPDSGLYVAKSGAFTSVIPETFAFDVKLSQPPGAEFTWSPHPAIAGSETTLIDMSEVLDGNLTSWAWDFGDGNSASCVASDTTPTCNPTHIYVAPGEYNARLTVVDEKGDVDSVQHMVTVVARNAVNDALYMPPGYLPPIAHVPDDFAVDEGSLVTLVGTGEPSELVSSYGWQQVDGTHVPLSNPSAATTEFTAPHVAAGEAEDLAFSLTVGDGIGLSTPAVVHVTVRSLNHAPVAHAGGTVEAQAGATVLLDGSSSSDADGDALGYVWTQTTGPKVDLKDTDKAVASFVAPAGLAVSQLAFTLQVTDGHHGPVLDTAMVLVRAKQVGAGFSFRSAGAADPGRILFVGGADGAVWDFGDHANATGKDPSHVYAAPGVYTVTMTQGSDVYSHAVTVTASMARAGQDAAGKAAGGAAADIHRSPGLGVVLIAALGLVAFGMRRRR